MRLLKLLSILGICFFSNTIHAALHQTTVELTLPSKSLSFNGKVRVLELIQAGVQQGAYIDYTLATTLFDESKQAREEVSSLQSFVLNQLMQKNLISHPFYKFLQKNSFSKRMLSNLDLDELRLHQEKNPLVNGNLSLHTPKRTDKVLFLGNLDKIVVIKDQQGIPLSNILENIGAVYDNRKPYPVIIYPDGNVVTPAKGSWRNTYYYLPPLSIVYFPFDDYQQSELDQNIVELLTLLKTHQ
ncbi:TPA: capsule biosynthesis GfcC family protein [Vibrio parahaemolyticus]|nr:capsule biosynthesis GfcC family protein [Vibrio parahaemolyticus]